MIIILTEINTCRQINTQFDVGAEIIMYFRVLGEVYGQNNH